MKALFVENNLDIINTVDYVSTYYPLLKYELSDVDYMSPIVDRENGLLRSINEENIVKISQDCLEDIFSGNKFNNLK